MPTTPQLSPSTYLIAYAIERRGLSKRGLDQRLYKNKRRSALVGLYGHRHKLRDLGSTRIVSSTRVNLTSQRKLFNQLEKIAVANRQITATIGGVHAVELLAKLRRCDNGDADRALSALLHIALVRRLNLRSCALEALVRKNEYSPPAERV